MLNAVPEKRNEIDTRLSKGQVHFERPNMCIVFAWFISMLSACSIGANMTYYHASGGRMLGDDNNVNLDGFSYVM